MFWALIGVIVVAAGFLRLGQLSVWVMVWGTFLKATGLLAAFLLVRHLWRRVRRT